MAIRTNCIEYGWQTDSSTINTGSFFNSITKNVYIPETASRLFTDTIMMFHGRNSGLEVGTSQADYTMSVQIDSNPTASFVSLPSVNLTAEHISYTHFNSCSAYFNTYFTSSNHAVKFVVKSNNTRTIGATFKLLCTYQFEDANVTTSIKTVRLPINTITASILPASEVYLGNYTASIPVLDTYLPESSKTYRDIFVEYHANDASTGVTNLEMRSRIDSNASSSRFTVSQSLQSSPYYYDLQTLSGSISTATTHSIRVGSNVASRFTGLFGILYCTYEYDYTGSSRILNSNIYSLSNASIYTSPRVGSYYMKRIYIPESGSIVLARSGVQLNYAGYGTEAVGVSVNSGSETRYAISAGSIQSGYIPILHQIDGTGSADGTIQLTSGYNNIRIYTRQSTLTTVGNMVGLGGIIYLNYYSDVQSGVRPLSHTHTIYKHLIGNNNFLSGATSFFYTSYVASSSIGEAKYYIGDVTNVYHIIFGRQSSVPLYDILESVCFYTGSDYYFDAGENPFKIGSLAMTNDARLMYLMSINDMTAYIQQYPEYTIRSNFPKINLRTSRIYGHRCISANITSIPSISHLQLITYHSIPFGISGSISNYSGTGAGIPVTVYDYDNGIKLFSTQSLSGGLINTYWYDRHTNLMLVAETGSKYVSNILPAGSGSFLISIPTSNVVTGSGGERSYTYIG